MSKYLELFKGAFDDSIGTKTKLENKPYIGYSSTGGVVYTVVPKPVTGPADNEIWYTTVDGGIINPAPVDDFGFGANITGNTYESSKGVITFDRDVTSVGWSAFFGCSSLTSITIPNRVTSIGSGAFSGCSGLTSVNIPGEITRILDFAFGGCSSLTSITIPCSVMEIGMGVFDSCSSLASITYEGTVEQWNAIPKGGDWKFGIPATYVQCSDGQVAL